MRHLIFAACAALTLAGPGFAHEFKLGGLTIGHPYALATPETAKAGAGYLTVTNDGAEADRLIAVEAPFPRAEIHATEIDAAGVARMMPVAAVEIAPGETVTLAPKGLHVMFMGLTAPLEEGGTIDATLVFEKAGSVDVEFTIEARPAQGEAGHGAEGHDHGAGG